MNLITAKLEITNARLAARVTVGTIGAPPVSFSVVTMALAVAVGLLTGTAAPPPLPPTTTASTTSRTESITS